jgi:soluble lytic murein transglycosylase-like protein
LKYKVDPRLLKAIAIVESGMDQRKVNRGRRGFSVGVMQVYSLWFPILRREGFDVQRLKRDACYNVLVGAWVLRRHIDEVGGDVWKGVGRYNAKSKVKQVRYVRKVRSVFRREGFVR